VAGGPNGILNVRPLSLFGHELPVSHEGIFNVSYLYVALAVFVVVFIALRFVNESRTGRAWRSLREDSLAAELMGMPVNWLKLMAFSFGAATAALTGTLVTALNGSVFPQTFEFPLLITVYTAVILGGAGSQAGVVIGAIGISVLLELLREPGDSHFLYYAIVLLALIGTLRFSRQLAFVLGGTLVFGFVLHALAAAIDGDWTRGVANGGGRLGDWANNWVVVPGELAGWVTPVSYIGLVAAVLALTVLQGWARLALLVPTLYLGAFVWENVMLAKPEPTRFVVLGALLIAAMIARPEGLLGEKRVEIV
jgi:ABC-type branched-subunit amino acid transport system permease subunit